MEQRSIDGKYGFSCTCCGDCCTGNMKININLFDLHKLVRRLNLISSGELFTRGLVKLVANQNGVPTPQVVFKKSPFAFCPWLINDLGEDGNLRGYCSLHRHDKPLICKMAPVSRVVDFESDSVNYTLTPPTESCPGMKSRCENSLDDLKKELEEELDYEYRFYRILDNLVGQKDVGEEYYSYLYTFEGRRDFEDILREREKRSGDS